jgi:diguanylate cyclase (GGDEF)-like protein/PAS domain S-box-containing protein
MFIIQDPLLESITNACPIGILLANQQGNIVFANDCALEMFKYSQQEIGHLTIEDLIPGRFKARHQILRQQFETLPQQRKLGHRQALLGINKDQLELPMEVGLRRINHQGEPYVVVTLVDKSLDNRIEQLEKTNQQLSLAATHDHLTGLSNRRLFIELVEKLIDLATRDRKYISIVFIDLDDFKQVNDNYGHDVGDKLLKAVATILEHNVRKSDVVSRIGGDEFLICFTQHQSQTSIIKHGQHIVKQIKQINKIDHHSIAISASVGIITTKASHTTELAKLVKLADQAMYKAKSAGKGCVVHQRIKS